jgi:hypothetical protein
MDGMIDDRDEPMTLPVILGQGSAHSVSDERPGRVFGQKGARIRVMPKRRRIGFHIPKKAPR